jgi:hypothetical protein
MVSMKPAGRRGRVLFFGMISGGTMSHRIAARHGDAFATRVLAHAIANTITGKHVDEKAHRDPSVLDTQLAESGIGLGSAIEHSQVPGCCP